MVGIQGLASEAVRFAQLGLIVIEVVALRRGG